MKKKTAAAALLLAVCVAFSGCADRGAESGGQSAGSTAAFSAQSQPEQSQPEQADDKTAYQMISQDGIRMLTSPYGNALAMGTQTDSGFYMVRQFNEGSQSIIYIDFGTKTMMYLCGQPNCTHTDSSCTSWLGGDPAWLVADGQELYMVGSSVMVRAGLDGGNRKTIYKTETGESFFGGIASNDREMFFVLENITSKEPTYTLAALDKEALTLQKIAVFDATTLVYAAQGHELILLQTEIPDADGAEEISTLIRYDLDTGAQEELRHWNTLDEFVEADSEIQVSVNYKDNCIQVYDLFGGNPPQTFAEGFLKENENSRVVAVRDGHAAIAVTEVGSGHPVYWVIDFETGSITHDVAVEQLLFDSSSAAEIRAETEDSYLVRSSIVEMDVPMHKNDGTTITEKMPMSVYSFISKEDYWAGRNNYVPITNTTF